MLRSLTLSLLSVAMLATAPVTAYAKPKLTPEAKLAKMLEGRTAGEPSNCIPQSHISQTTVIDGTAIVYRIGSTLWVNRPKDPPRAMDGHNVMVTKTSINQLCSVDTVQLLDPSTRSWRGFIQLGDFVPYRKTE